MRFIGINGGTFDPVHIGHLRAALEVQTKLGLEQVRFVPCFNPVHRLAPSASAQQRSAMLALALADQPTFYLDTTEMDLGGPSYMVNTLRALKVQFGNESLVLMMGTDAFAKFDTWHDWQGILALANIAVMHRPSEPWPVQSSAAIIYQTYGVSQLTQANGQVIEVAITQLDISSTVVRALCQSKQSIKYLVPAAVIDYIEQQKLYKQFD
ncbi:nicotinate-nucleotide adenylyltransferase [Thiomicrorhabdus aquaedulcis]|uniref:nicotinate-nucleotide adenylyltransferase n=1 Tax=Thiomicrorhabdus aquaedulcis TaxID=2211106 RepID=UPI001E5B3A4C|nr:nicotinate-nucleotide adenylyltransferase [Thiomicrorhabdus aquaedulcis]